MNIDLTYAQQASVGEAWLAREMQSDPKRILRKLFAFGANWSWSEMLSFSIDECAKNYHVPRTTILEDLGVNLQEPGLLALQALIEATDEMNAAGPEESDRRALAQARFIQAWEKARELVDPSTD